MANEAVDAVSEESPFKKFSCTVATGMIQDGEDDTHVLKNMYVLNRGELDEKVG